MTSLSKVKGGSVLSVDGDFYVRAHTRASSLMPLLIKDQSNLFLRISDADKFDFQEINSVNTFCIDKNNVNAFKAKALQVTKASKGFLTVVNIPQTPMMSELESVLLLNSEGKKPSAVAVLKRTEAGLLPLVISVVEKVNSVSNGEENSLTYFSPKSFKSDLKMLYVEAEKLGITSAYAVDGATVSTDVALSVLIYGRKGSDRPILLGGTRLGSDIRFDAVVKSAIDTLNGALVNLNVSQVVELDIKPDLVSIKDRDDSSVLSMGM